MDALLLLKGHENTPDMVACPYYKTMSESNSMNYKAPSSEFLCGSLSDS